MDLGLQFEELKCYSCVLDTVTRREETQEAIVSDALPDIGTVITVTATPFLHHSRVENGAVYGEGEIAAVILYEPDSGSSVCSIHVRIPYRSSAESTQVTAECAINVGVSLRNIDVKVMNPRKILVQTEVALHFSAFLPQTMRFSVDLSDHLQDMQLKHERLPLQYVSHVTEKSFPFEESVSLSGAHRAIRQLLGCDFVPYCSESKLVGSKVVFKGGVKVCAKFIGEDDLLARETYDLPVSQVLDAGASGEAAASCVSLTVMDAEAVLSDRGTLDVTMELYACATLIDCRNMNMLVDAYSTHGRCQCGVQTTETLNLTAQNRLVHPFRQTLDTELPSAEVLMESVSMAELMSDMEGGQRCRLKISCCLRERDGRLMKVDQNCYLDLPLPQTISARPILSVQLLDAACVSTAGGLEVRGSLLIHYASVAAIETHCLSSILLDDEPQNTDERKPSAVLRKMRCGETLWDLGKEYSSSVDDIKIVNQITDEAAAGGRFLLIPRNR